MQHFDLIIIGSGPGGYKAAITAAHLGAKVALVERGLVGGTCLNQGCIPKKTLLHLATLMEEANRMQGRGLVGAVHGDFMAALAHKDEVVESIRANFPVWLKRLGVRVINGSASFASPFAIRIESDGAVEELTARRVIIATGAEPQELPACPTDGRIVINSRDFMFKQDRLPKSILFVGGGAIGVELGYLLNQFGAKVTIVEQGENLLCQAHLPERASNLLERKFKRLGIEVRTELSVAACDISSGKAMVSFTDGSSAEYEQVMVAIGRKPCIEGLNLQAAGVALTNDGFIQTSAHLETSVPGIYAIGDVKRGPMTANAALHDAKIAAANAVNGNAFHPNYFKVPVVFHSAVEIAAVGLMEHHAEKAGFEPEAARSNLGGSGKARAHHDTEGFIEVVHDTETGQLLGGCIVGPEAGEQIHMLAAACQSERGLWFFKDMSYSHPSWCEELETAIDPYTSAFSRSEKDVFQPGIYAQHG